jgi:hypothetical protein
MTSCTSHHPGPRGWLAAAALAAGLGLATGCAPSIDSLRADPTLTFREVQRGKVALLPVAARAQEVTLEELTYLDRLLALAFDRRARGLRRVPSDVVVRAIATDATNWETVVRFANTGKADIRALDRLSGSVGAQYLVFTSVDYDEIWNPFSDFERTVAYSAGPSPWPRGSGDWHVFGRKNKYQGPPPSTSELVASLWLIDVEAGQVRWEGKHRVLRSAGNTTSAPKPSRAAWPLFSRMAAALPHE